MSPIVRLSAPGCASRWICARRSDALMATRLPLKDPGAYVVHHDGRAAAAAGTSSVAPAAACVSGGLRTLGSGSCQLVVVGCCWLLLGRRKVVGCCWAGGRLARNPSRAQIPSLSCAVAALCKMDCVWAVYYKQIRKSEQRPPLHLRAADLVPQPRTPVCHMAIARSKLRQD